MERADVVGRNRPDGALAPRGRVAVRMCTVQDAQKRAVGDRARVVAQLRQPMQPQLPHARDIFDGKGRPRGDVGHEP